MKAITPSGFFALALLAALAACSKEDEEKVTGTRSRDEYVIEQPAERAPQGEHLVSRQQAVANAAVFMQEFQKQTFLQLPTEVAGVVPFTRHSLHLTRAAAEKDDTLFYAVNYKDDRGFVLASADDRLTPVLAFVDNGNYAPGDTTNIGFNMFVNNIINKYYKRDDQSLLRGNERNMGFFTESSLQYKMLYTTWGDRSPYNRYLTSDMLKGCCIALGQICAFTGKPASFGFGQRTVSLDWTSLRRILLQNNGEVTPESSDADKVAMLMASFSKTPTEEFTTDCQDHYLAHLNQWKFKLSTFSNSSIDDFAVIQALRNRKLVYATGLAHRYDEHGVLYTDRHAWVIDGYFYAEAGSVRGTYLHCNWGASGDKDGYYLCNAFDPDEQPERGIADGTTTVGFHGGYYSFRNYWAIVHPN